MPTATTRSSARSHAEAALAAMPGLREVIDELGLYADLDAELDRCIAPLHLSPHPNREARRSHGVRFDPAEVRRFLQFCRKQRHVKTSRWAGRPFVPDLWQVLFVIAPVFGWRKTDGNRWFLVLWLEVPRKNGKSTLCAVIALYLLTADSNLVAGRKAEPGAEVYSAATTTRQAQEVFRPAETMARRSPALQRRLGIQTDKALIYERTASRYEVLSGDAAKAEEKMGLNPSGYVIDEIHVHRDRRLIDTIESAVGAREQPLGVFITTAGDDTEGTIYAEKHDYAVAVSVRLGSTTGPEIDGSRTWAVIYTIPDEMLADWDKPSTWQAANPGFAISVSPDFLEEEAKKGRHSPAKRRSFCRLHLNVRQSSVSRWLDIDAWDRSGVHLLRRADNELHDKVAYAGLDLSSSTDLTAIALVVPTLDRDRDESDRQVEHLNVVLRAWVPAESLTRRPPAEEALFRELIAAGELLVCDGDVIDYDQVETEAFQLAKDFELRRLSFDRWGSKQIVQHLSDGGLTVVDMGQGFASMSPPMKEAERLILAGRLHHRGNRLLRHAVKSLAVKLDPAGNIKPDRSRSTGRIDPWVATVMGLDGWMRDVGQQRTYRAMGF